MIGRRPYAAFGNSPGDRKMLEYTRASDGARLRVASELLDSDYPAHKAAGAKLYAAAMHEQRLTERDQRLLAGEHPGNADGRYQTACAYANRWGLPTPSARRASSSASVSDERL